MTLGPLTYTARKHEWIDDSALEACRFARRMDWPVLLVFDGINVAVLPTSKPADIERIYRAAEKDQPKRKRKRK